jgi:hypothetical protein
MLYSLDEIEIKRKIAARNVRIAFIGLGRVGCL